MMVRVGGGWAALDEFLVKNDPVRAESWGRTGHVSHQGVVVVVVDGQERCAICFGLATWDL